MIRILCLLSAVVFCTVSFFSCGVSFAEEWKLFYKSEEDNLSFYFDKASIERPDKKKVKVTEKITEKGDDDEEVQKYINVIQIDCREREFKILSSTEYNMETEQKVPEKGPAGEKKKEKFLTNARLGSLYDNVCY